MALRGQYTAAHKARTIYAFIVGITLTAQPLIGVVLADTAAAAPSPTVVINEVAPIPSGEGWVELYNAADTDVAIGGWQLLLGADAVGSPVAVGTTIASHGFYNVTAGEGQLPMVSSSPLQLRTDTGTMIDTVDSWVVAAGESYARTTDAGDIWAVGTPTKDMTNYVAPVPQLTIEQFATTTTDYKGLSVQFAGKDFGTVSAVTVDVARADGTHVTKHGSQALFDLLSGKPTTIRATAPIVVQAGSFNEAGDSDWQPADSAVWTSDTAPTGVTVTITDENGSTQATATAFDQAAGSYESLLPAVAVPPAGDTTSPTLLIDGPSTINLDGSATFTVMSSEALMVLHVFVDGTELTAGVEKVADTAWRIAYAPPTTGSYTFVVGGTDLAGNSSRGVVTTLMVNPNPPTVEQATAAGRQLEDAVAALTQPLNTVKDIIPATSMSKNIPTDMDMAVLGNSAEKSIDTTDHTSTAGAVVSTENGWRIFGLLWYWWALLIGAAIAIGWRLLPVLQRRESDAV